MEGLVELTTPVRSEPLKGLLPEWAANPNLNSTGFYEVDKAIQDINNFERDSLDRIDTAKRVHQDSVAAGQRQLESQASSLLDAHHSLESDIGRQTSHIFDSGRVSGLQAGAASNNPNQQHLILAGVAVLGWYLWKGKF